MTLRLTLGTLGALALAATALPAVAGTCYVVYDRGNNVVYQGQHPPAPAEPAPAGPGGRTRRVRRPSAA